MRESGELDIRVVFSYKSSGHFTVQTFFTATFTSDEFLMVFSLLQFVKASNNTHVYFPRVLTGFEAQYDRLGSSISKVGS